MTCPYARGVDDVKQAMIDYKEKKQKSLRQKLMTWRE